MSELAAQVGKGKDSGAFKDEPAPASAADAKSAVDKNDEVDEEVEAVMKSVAESLNQLKLKARHHVRVSLNAAL